MIRVLRRNRQPASSGRAPDRSASGAADSTYLRLDGTSAEKLARSSTEGLLRNRGAARVGRGRKQRPRGTVRRGRHTGVGGPGPEARGRPPIPALPSRARGGTTEVARRVRTIISLHTDGEDGGTGVVDRSGPGEGTVLRGMGLLAAPMSSPPGSPQFEAPASETRVPRHITRLMEAQRGGSSALLLDGSTPTPSPPPSSPTPGTPPRGSGLSTLSSSESGRAVLADVDENVDESAGDGMAAPVAGSGDAAQMRESRRPLRPSLSAITLDGEMVRPGSAPRTTSPPSGGRLAAGRATLWPLQRGGLQAPSTLSGRAQAPTSPPVAAATPTPAPMPVATPTASAPLARGGRGFTSPLQPTRAAHSQRLPASRAAHGRARPGLHHAVPASPVRALDPVFREPEYAALSWGRPQPHRSILHSSAVLVGAPAPRSGPRPGTAPSSRVMPASARDVALGTPWVYDWSYLATRSAEAVAEEAGAAIAQGLPGPWAGDGGREGERGLKLTPVPIEEGGEAPVGGTALARRPATAAGGARARSRARSGRSPVGLDGASVTIQPHRGDSAASGELLDEARGGSEGVGEGEGGAEVPVSGEEGEEEEEEEGDTGMVVRVHARHAPRPRPGLPAVRSRTPSRRKRPVSAHAGRTVPRGRVLSGW